MCTGNHIYHLIYNETLLFPTQCTDVFMIFSMNKECFVNNIN